MLDKTTKQIIGILLPDLKREYTIREISKISGISYDSVYRHVITLIEKRILNDRKVGKSRLCSINSESEEARKLVETLSLEKTKNFLSKNISLKRLIDELIKNLEKTIPDMILSVILFGSYTKQRVSRESDIDILFLVSDFKAKDKIDKICMEMSWKYGKDISPLVSTLTEFEKMLKSEEQTIGKEILEDNIVLYGYEKFYSSVFRSV